MADLQGFGSDSIVLRRPHFRSEGDKLYFLASNRPYRQLSTAEQDIWSAIEQPITMDVLRERYPGHAENIIREFWSSHLCELVEPVFAPHRRRVLVVEPHSDDAALSLGGVMWLRRRECAFIVATMASRSNYSSYYDTARDFLDVERVTNIRRRESGLFARMIGGSHVAIGLSDAVLRYRDTNWSVPDFQRHRVSIGVSTSRSVRDEDRERWNQAVIRLLKDTPSDEVWIPLGAPHADHRLTMNACLAACVSDPQLVAGRVVRVYQDVPYAARFPGFTSEMCAALTDAGVKLESETIRIDDAFEHKLRLVSVFASQFKLSAVRSDIEKNALMQ